MSDNKSIEQLENDFWGNAPTESSNLVLKIHSLRRKKLSELEPEDIRVLISQNVSLEILIPLALKVLETNPFIECDYYEGDLLKSVLTSKGNYWTKHPDKRREIFELFERNKEALINLDTTDDIRDSLIDSFKEFSESM